MGHGHSKTDYLDLAVQLAQNASSGRRPFQFAVAHVDIADVARAAGVTRGALYRIWETNDDFWTDLAVYIAILDDAPWVLTLVSDLDVSASYPDAFYEQTRRFLTAAEAELGTDPRPLLRAGIVGYAGRSPAASVLARGERARLASLAGLSNFALLGTRRQMTGELSTLDFSILVNALADGFAISARFDTGPREISLLALCDCVLAHGVAEPDDAELSPDMFSFDVDIDVAPERDDRPTGKRREYLRLAAALVIQRHGTAPDTGRARGPISIDGLARFAGVSRAAIRRLWSNQTTLAFDIADHLFTAETRRVADIVEREVEIARRQPTSLRDATQRIGDAMYADAAAHADELSFLAFAPHLDEPLLRAHLAQSHAAAGDAIAAALAALMDATGATPRPGFTMVHFTSFLLASQMGMVRTIRAHPDLVRPSTLGVMTREVFVQLTDSRSGTDWRGIPPWVPDLSLPSARAEAFTP